MDMIFSKRATQIEEGIFSILNTKKEELLQAGREVYNFSVGTPDFKTPEHIMKAMEEACKDPDNYKYAMADRPEMLEAMKNFYKNRFDVELETDQIMSMYGSQEGMAHIALVMCDPGDVVLVPNPGYPVFGMGPQLMGAKVETYPLYAENNFLPDFADIPEETAKAAKFMIISYPANPVCSVADDSFYEKAIAFAKKYNVTKEAIAIAWILRHPAKMQPIVGTTNKDRIKAICKASEVVLSREEWYELYRAAGNKLP